MSEMNELIANEPSLEKRTILRELKKYNKFAHEWMHKFGSTWKQKYQSLQKTKEWRKARRLLKGYFTNDNNLICKECNKEIKGSFTLHHDMYGKPYDFFNPLYIKLICSYHHTKDFHKKR